MEEGESVRKQASTIQAVASIGPIPGIFSDVTHVTGLTTATWPGRQETDVPLTPESAIPGCLRRASIERFAKKITGRPASETLGLFAKYCVSGRSSSSDPPWARGSSRIVSPSPSVSRSS